MSRPTSALAATLLGALMAAAATFGQQLAQRPSADSDAALANSMKAARSVRHLLRNGMDYLSYQEYERALDFFREAEARQSELSPEELRTLMQGIERARKGMRAAADAPRTSYAKSRGTSRAGAIAAGSPAPENATPPRDPVQLTGAEVTEPPARVAPAPRPSQIPAAPPAAAQPPAQVALEPVFGIAPLTPIEQPAPVNPAPSAVEPSAAGAPEPAAPPRVDMAPAIALTGLPPQSDEPPLRSPSQTPQPSTAPSPQPAPAMPPTQPSQRTSTFELPRLPGEPAEPPAPPEPLVAPASPAVDLPALPPLSDMPSTSDEAAPTTPVRPLARPATVPSSDMPIPVPDAAEPSARHRGFTAQERAALPAPAVESNGGAGRLVPRLEPERSRMQLPPRLQREVEEIARAQEEAVRRDQAQAGAGREYAESDQPTTRLEMPRAPSPTEARPIRAIPVPDEFVPLAPREWSPNRKYWAAAATCHSPLYFQDAALERYGHSVEQFFGPAGRCLTYPIDDPTQSKLRNQIAQPFFSAGLFAAQILALPVNLVLDPPWEAEYDLGYYRPGDRIPTDVYYLPTHGVGPPFRGMNY